MVWPIAAASLSAVLALFLKKRGDDLSQQCDRALDQLEATEDELEDLKMEVKALTDQVTAQDTTIREVSAARILRKLQISASRRQHRSAKKLPIAVPPPPPSSLLLFSGALSIIIAFLRSVSDRLRLLPF
jgi:cell division protein FtsB